MPYYEYRCTCGSDTEVFYRSIAEGQKHPTVICSVCGLEAGRVPSVPFPAHLYGNPEGYSKPSPLKRHSTKLASAEGNDKT